MRKLISIILALLLFINSTTKAETLTFFSDSLFEETFRGILYGGMIGLLVGGAQGKSKKDLWKTTCQGALVGATIAIGSHIINTYNSPYNTHPYYSYRNYRNAQPNAQPHLHTRPFLYVGYLYEPRHLQIVTEEVKHIFTPTIRWEGAPYYLIINLNHGGNFVRATAIILETSSGRVISEGESIIFFPLEKVNLEKVNINYDVKRLIKEEMEENAIRQAIREALLH